MPSGMIEVGRATVTIIPNMQGAQQTIASELGAASESAGSSAGSKAGSAFTSGMGSMISAGAAVVTGAVAAVTGAAVGAGKAIWDSASQVAQFGDNIDKASQKMGISAEAYQEWDAVLKHSGSSIDAMSASFKKLAVASVDGTDDQIAAFARVGVSLDDLENGLYSQEELFGKVIEGLQGMGEGALRTETATQLLGKGATELGALLNTSAEETQAMKDRLHELGGVMSDAAVKNAATFQDTLQNLTTATDGLKNSLVSNLLPSLTTVMNGFTGLITGTDGAEKQISSGINSLITNITTALPQVLEAVSSIVDGVVSVAPELITTLADAIINMMPTLGNTFLEVGGKIVDALMSVLPKMLEAGLKLIIQLAQGITQAIPKLLPAIVNLVSDLAKMIINNLPELLKAGLELVMALAQGIADNAGDLAVAAIQLVTELETFIIENLPEIMQTGLEIVLALINGIVESLPELTTAITDMMTTFVETVTDNLPEILKCGLEILAALAKGLLQALPELIMVVPKIYKGLFDKLILMDWKSIGRNIINGIKEGVLKAKDTLLKAFQDLCTEAWGKVKDFFGIKSPSRLMAYAGRMIGEGLVKGIEGEESAVDRAMTRLSNVTFGSFTPALAVAGDMGGAGSSSIVNTITVNGASDPELWAQGFIRTINRQERMLNG